MYNEDEKTAIVDTYNKRMIKKLDKLCADHPSLFTLIESTKYGNNVYSIPKRNIAIRTPKILTDEQKQKLKDRMLASKSKSDV